MEKMKIKDHQKVKRRWGSWSQPLVTHGVGFKFGPGDIGDCVLKTAKYSPKDRSNQAKIELDTEYQGRRVSISHAFDDSDFADKLYKKLTADCIGKTIKEIGEVEIDF